MYSYSKLQKVSYCFLTVQILSTAHSNHFSEDGSSIMFLRVSCKSGRKSGEMRKKDEWHEDLS